MNAIKPPFKRSPLSHREMISSDNVSMQERPYSTHITLRGEMTVLDGVVKSVVGVEAPKPNMSASKAERSVHWLGPDTLLITGPEGDEKTLSDGLDTAMANQSGQVVPAGNYYTTIELSGTRVRDLLQKLSTLDLDQAEFKAGRVAGTTLAQASVILSCREETVFDVITRRSHGDYLWCLLANAGYEYGLPKQEPVAGETMRQ